VNQIHCSTKSITAPDSNLHNVPASNQNGTPLPEVPTIETTIERESTRERERARERARERETQNGGRRRRSRGGCTSRKVWCSGERQQRERERERVAEAGAGRKKRVHDFRTLNKPYSFGC